MSVLNNSNAISTGGAFNITDSLRFRGGQNLTRTITSASNRRTYTYSFWIKRGNLGTSPYVFNQYLDGNTNSLCYFNASGSEAFNVFNRIGGTNYQVQTSAVFRDTSAWYHIVVATDTTQATASDRVKIWINGEQVTSFSVTGYPPQNSDTAMNSASAFYIGSGFAPSQYFDGYMTEWNFVDGQALTASDFGETNADGVWSPKKYTGTYGTNGFYLPMKETTQATGFNTVLYTGNGSGQTIQGVGFSPDLIWIKNRDAVQDHILANTVVGVGQQLVSNSTASEITTGRLQGDSSIYNDGFRVGGHASVNGSGNNMVAWCWDAGSSTVSNTDGTITSSVRANPASGFSVVTYTGTGSSGTVGHGLGSTPDMIIVKRRNAVDSWFCYHSALTTDNYMLLNGTNAVQSLSGYWGTPSSTTFGAVYGGTNTSGGTYVAYCFSEVAGYSKFGSYTGNGSTSGPTVTTGFTPAFVMMKRTDSTSNWLMFDRTRGVDDSLNDNYLYANASGVEGTSSTLGIEITSTGFVLKNAYNDANASGGTYIYMAFADTRDYQWNFDASGNKNNWTPNNINSNASSESTYDLMSDVPSLADEDTGNFATLNPNAIENVSAGGGTFSNANLTITAGAGGSDAIHPVASIGTYPIGKSYWEITIDNAGNGGNQTTYISIGKLGGGGVMFAYGKNGYSYDIGAGWVASDLPTYTTGDIIGVAFDQSTSSTQATLKWYKNGTLVGTKTASYNSSHPKEELTASCRVQYNAKFSFNFGQRPFAYTPPTGYKKLNTYNLPDSSITDGSQYFDVDTWSGDSSATTQIATPFSPDFVWIKNRSNTGGSGSASHMLYDTVRGVQKELQTNLTNAEGTLSTGLNSFDSDGYKPGTSTRTNATGNTYVGWSWRGSDSAPVSNTDGTITSTVSANPTSGFSVVTYTGNGSANQTVGHGLGQTPKIIIYKNRSSATAWRVIPAFINDGYYLALNDTSAMVTASTSYFGSNTSTTLGISGSNSGIINASGDNLVAYAFAEVEGFSKIGSYTGNGSTDGPFVYTGFRPAFILEKNANSAYGWLLWDTSRSAYNMVTKYLVANSSGAEVDTLGASGPNIDILSNGFKVRDPNPGWNQNGSTHVYMAFAENPFKNSLAR